ncbi:MAG TPA: hotdog fold thioesterase [Chitinophagales bacterium]|nr:hotdog fold thioesterase [Chitinophagales bacterium]
MSIWKIPVTAELLNKNTGDTMVTYLGIEFTEIGDDFIAGKMPVDDRTRQPFGILHGGAHVVLAETLGSTAANLVLEPGSSHAVGLDINSNHIKSVRDGYVYGVAKPIHLGNSTQVWEIKISDEQGSLLNISRLTMYVVQKKGK